ncbi:MAG: class I SAM-dependent methyltransferase [Bacteroidota bacterium]|nr:class I SAM-dependent methyltransferase [Bacteroidota bacterium]MDP4194985.1 class I SAM-dependent methyltransferase [Bacteroidota bacterium]
MIVQKAYDNWSKTYDSDINLTRDLDEVVLKETFDDMHFKRVLEVGCGTGKNTGFLSSIADSVSAIDFSDGMIMKAKEKNTSDNVLFSIADITKPWTFENESFNLIVCDLILEHIEDLLFVFNEASRTLVNGGVLFINELHPFRQYQGKKAHFERNGKTIEINAFIHNVSDFFSCGTKSGLLLKDLKECWHKKDQNKLPRLISLKFEKTIH